MAERHGARESHEDRSAPRGGQWIFAEDPYVQPTDRLPDLSDPEVADSPLAARREAPAQPPAPPGVRTAASRLLFDPPATTTREMPAVPTDTGAIAALDQDAPSADAVAGDAAAQTGEPRVQGRASIAVPSYARSGTTPSEPDYRRRVELPERFHDMNFFDVLRDITALICLISAISTTFTAQRIAWLDITGTVTGGIAIAGIVLAQGLRWGLKPPRTHLTRWVRVLSQIPALLTALLVLGTDLVVSLPRLFSPMPDGPPVGIGVGVSLMLLGSLIGVEPRAHCGYLPAQRARRRIRRGLIGVGIAAAASFLLALVMIIGRVFTTGWAYSLWALAGAIVSTVVLLIFFGAALMRDRSWFITSVAMVAGLMIGALADNTLELDFAAPLSFATGFVYLPFLFAAFGMAVSRSFVRTMPVTFQRVDWLVYATRAFELSAVMHTVAVLWNVMTAIAVLGGYGRGFIIHLVQAAVCAIFAATSLYARRALLERPAVQARATAVVASLVLVMVGFLMVIVGSLAIGAGAGLANGGVALTVGVLAALMLTVPSPVRDEFGAPDLVRMFEEYRRRDTARTGLLSRLPDISAERARRKEFPSGRDTA